VATFADIIGSFVDCDRRLSVARINLAFEIFDPFTVEEQRSIQREK
jgi:hypothetical protein